MRTMRWVWSPQATAACAPWPPPWLPGLDRELGREVDGERSQGGGWGGPPPHDVDGVGGGPTELSLALALLSHSCVYGKPQRTSSSQLRPHQFLSRWASYTASACARVKPVRDTLLQTLTDPFGTGERAHCSRYYVSSFAVIA